MTSRSNQPPLASRAANGSPSLQDRLDTLFAADLAARAAEDAVLDAPREALSTVLRAAAEEALRHHDQEEGEARLERICDLCAQVGGRDTMDTLLLILNHEEPAVRSRAGEAVLELGYSRYADLANAVDRLLSEEAAGIAMAELPGILGEIGEPSAVPLVRKFLNLSNPDAIAAAMEVLAVLGDPAAIPDLERFIGDATRVVLEDAEEETEATLGELAEEAIAALQEAN